MSAIFFCDLGEGST